MSGAFRPADGERARWRYVYDLVESKKPGDGIAYDEVEELLNVDRLTAQAAVREAMRHLEWDGKRSLRTKRKFGWIVMTGAEHVDEAEHSLSRARNAAKATTRKLIAPMHGLRAELTQEQRRAADFAATRASFMANIGTRNPKTFAELTSR